MSAYRKGLKAKTSGHIALVKRFYSKYRARIVAAIPKYGDFNPETDPRFFSVESQEECLDIGSYLEFGEAKRPDLSPFLQKIRAHFILGYEMLEEWGAIGANPCERG